MQKRKSEYNPSKILHTKEELVTICTMIIFQSSVKHAAVNNLQWEYGSFAPVSPLSMRGELPTEGDRGKITRNTIMESLPGPKNCIRSAGIAYTLTEFSDDEVFLLHKAKRKREKRSRSLGDLKLKGRKAFRLKHQMSVHQDNAMGLVDTSGAFPPRWLFIEEEVKLAFLEFQFKLQQIEDEIRERNLALVQAGGVPYEVLLPSRIQSGIAI